MNPAKPARRRWRLPLAAAVLAVLAALVLLPLMFMGSSIEPAMRPPPPETTAPGEPPDSGGSGPPREAANGGDGSRPAEPEPVVAPPEPPPSSLPAPAEPPPIAGGDGPGEPAPTETPRQGEGGFGDFDKAYENGGGGSLPEAGVEPGAGAPADEPVERFPYLDAPEAVAPGQRIAVTVALTLDPLTPGVTARPGPGATLSPEGALGLPLPADADQWPIDVDLIAPGFEAADGAKLQQRIVLYRDNDSDFARFDLTLRAGEKPGVERRLAVRFYHAGRFLGSGTRPIRVVAAEPAARPSALSAAGASVARAEAIAVDDDGESPDMDVLVQFDDPTHPRRAAVYIHSPHIAGAVVGAFDLPDGALQWIDGNLAQLVTLGSRLRSARALDTPEDADPGAQRRRIVAFAEGFGDELYRRYAPEDFRRVFEQLRREGRLSSLLVSSNSPAIPWELLFAPQGDGAPGGFLGLTTRLGRWTPRDGGDLTDRPGSQIVFDGVAAVAPHYEGREALPFQQREIDALSALAGFDAVGGDYAAFEALVRDPLRRFVHFSGHGAVGDARAGEAPFAILLEDERVDPTTWRRIAGAPDPARRPFYFFNACDSGAAKVMGGFVQGWGATVLESGASGFIGGMWPLADEAAATFAAEYYARLTEGLAGDRVRVADVLRQVRRGFYATGDPTYLAYTFYGDPNLTVVRSPR